MIPETFEGRHGLAPLLEGEFNASYIRLRVLNMESVPILTIRGPAQTGYTCTLVVLSLETATTTPTASVPRKHLRVISPFPSIEDCILFTYQLPIANAVGLCITLNLCRPPLL